MIILNDLKYSLRLLLKHPGFTCLTVFVMALGLSLSVFLMSFLNTMAFKTLPFENSDTLYEFSAMENGRWRWGGLNLYDIEEIKSQVVGLTEYGLYREESVNIVTELTTRRYSGTYSSENIHALTRTQPLLGRSFVAQDMVKGANPVVIFSYDVWQTLYSGQDSIVGKSVMLNGQAHEIIGVMPPGYAFPSVTDLWLPVTESVKTSTREQASHYYLLAHLDQKVDKQTVDNQIKRIMQQLEAEYPETNSTVTAYLETIPLIRTGAAEGMPMVYTMRFTAILILILASVNVGNLLLTRAIDRSKETAIRVALGAPRFRLVTQMLWECLIICLLGGLFGLIFLGLALEFTQDIVQGFFVGKISFWMDFKIDAYTLATFFISLLSTIVITGILPVFKNMQSNISNILRDGTRGAKGKNHGRLNHLLVVSEIFLSMTILIVALVIMVGTYKTNHKEVGGNMVHFYSAEANLPKSSYPTNKDQSVFVNRLQAQLDSTAGFTDAVIMSALPGEHSWRVGMALEGREYTDKYAFPKENYVTLTIGSLPKLDIRLLAGRYFNSSDQSAEGTSVIVTQSFTKKYFGQESAIGKQIRIAGLEGDAKYQWLTIIGVVEHVLHGRGSEVEHVATVYRPYSQAPRDYVHIGVRSTQGINFVENGIREALRQVDDEIPAFKIETFEDNMRRYTAPMQFISKVFLAFGITAVFLTATGIYGIMSNSISMKTQEIGVKRALGAIDSTILREHLFQSSKHLLWGGIPGVISGGAIGFTISRFLSTKNQDLFMVIMALSIVITVVVCLATYLPTRKVLKLTPAEALRYE